MRFGKTSATRGFTFTELMVALAVVAVLVALVGMAVHHVSTVGERVKCATNLRQGAAGFLAYTTDRQGTFPSADAWYNRGYDKTNPGMREYMNVSEINDETRTTTQWTCPALQRDPKTRPVQTSVFRRTYGLNLYATNGHKNYSLQNFSRIPHPSRMLMFMDGSIQSATLNANTYHICNFTNYPERQTAPHGGRLNAAFLDGHVESLTPAQLFATEGFDSRWQGK